MDNFALVVCGGMQPADHNAPILTTIATDDMLSQATLLVFPAHPPWTVLSGQAIRQWLDQSLESAANATVPSRLIVWAFSAGCVGTAALVSHWQRYRGDVLAYFALDGWGVPLTMPVPIYRLSHDRFTHDTCRWLGGGPINFYAEPEVPHERLWQQPQEISGWQTRETAAGTVLQSRLTAAEFLCHWSRHHLNYGRK